jgi:hypothetical protein
MRAVSTTPETGPAPTDPAGFAAWVRPHLPAMARLAARSPVGLTGAGPGSGEPGPAGVRRP